MIVLQFITRGRIAYEPAKKRIYVNRAAGGYRHYCAAYGDIDAGIAKGQEAGTGRNLS
jgi:hypothetical protein